MGKNNNKRKADSSAEESENKSKVADTKPEPETTVPAEEKKDTPKQRFFDHLNEVMKRVGGKGYSIEQGVDDDENDEEGEDDGEIEIYGGEDEGDEEEGDGDNDEEEDDEEIEEVGEEENDEEQGEGEEDDAEEDEDDIVLAEGDLSDEDEEDDREYTEEELTRLRYVIVTDRREKTLEQYSNLVLGEQAEGGLLMFDSSFSADIFKKIPPEIKKILKKKSPAEKFDELYGLTKALLNYNVWMFDYEDADALKSLAKQLASAWKGLLALSDKELDIDPEFTRPGIEALMDNMVEGFAQCQDEVEFEWK
jgi:hypothetical protein